MDHQDHREPTGSRLFQRLNSPQLYPDQVQDQPGHDSVANKPIMDWNPRSPLTHPNIHPRLYPDYHPEYLPIPPLPELIHLHLHPPSNHPQWEE